MRLLTTIIATVAFSSAMAQSNNEVPRLVVGITIDNLRTDYLNAFAPLYGEKGFKKLLTEGQVYSNVQYPSKGIDRASAIATIATGSAPYNHGIIANEWLERSSLSKKFCVDYDETGSIGKRYRRQDEIGTPLCVTYDFESVDDGCVTVRDRDTMEQERIKIEDLTAYIEKRMEF